MTCQFANHLIPTCFQQVNNGQMKTSDFCEICRLKKRISNPSNQRRKQKREEARMISINGPGPSSTITMSPQEIGHYQSPNVNGMVVNFMRRDTWRRPCALGATQILVGDSQIRRLSAPLCPGSLQISYSGADSLGELEFSNLDSIKKSIFYRSLSSPLFWFGNIWKIQQWIFELSAALEIY